MARISPPRLVTATTAGTFTETAAACTTACTSEAVSSGELVTEAAGALETPQQGVDVLRPGGTLVIVGICPDDRIPLTASAPRRKGVTIKLSRRMKHVYPRTIALVEHGLVDLDQIISHHYPLDRTTEAFERLTQPATDALKIIVEP